jgi:hypothetical protein
LEEARYKQRDFSGKHHLLPRKLLCRENYFATLFTCKISQWKFHCHFISLQMTENPLKDYAFEHSFQKNLDMQWDLTLSLLITCPLTYPLCNKA